ncbi:dienelactone hydrolase family protein [Geodermatophilus sp. YIM 151500]|uniref:dienelactone hydrolase family protein n=1 Tax=Geodermatophilus sp. YIM 151500 TaxID=2984531 RepID=UPI0021E4EBF4|nr:dienelactone hydrolase family protein [Geodermatophilus sp. YIM 151500]MCV2489726.1 dienelactone hydrolase family protein [Geodermatophilus sp. YIM 151500]
MTDVALFHSALGVRPGVLDAAERLRADGHTVLVVDQYDGRVFDDQTEAGRFVDEVGFPELMRRAVAAAEPLADGFVAAGFSNGAGMAEHVATTRRCSGVLLVSGALPLAVLGGPAWPRGTAVQMHNALGDPLRHQDWLDAFVGEVRAAGAPTETYEYPATGHLFTDPSLPGEYDAQASEQLWERALRFVRTAPDGAAATGT